MDSLSNVLAELAITRVGAFDLEAVSATGIPGDAKNPRKAIPTIISLSTKSYYTAVSATEETLKILADLLYDERALIVCHNATYDIELLHNRKVIDFSKIKATVIDTVVAAWLVDETVDHGLKEQIKSLFGHKMTTYKEVSSSSATMIAVNVINARLAELDKTIADWPKKVPPDDMSHQPLGKTTLRRYLAESEHVPQSELTAKVNSLRSEERKAEFIAYSELEKKRLAIQLQSLLFQAEKEMRDYAADDSKWTLRLYSKLLAKLKKMDALGWWKIENDVRLISVGMNLRGAYLDINALEELKATIAPLIEEFKAELTSQIKRDINIDSGDQLRQVLFIDMGILPPVNFKDQSGRLIPKLTPAGQKLFLAGKLHADLRFPEKISEETRRDYFSVDKDVLERLDHPIGQAILNYRTAEKLHSTYVDGFLEAVRGAEVPRLYCKFNSVGTETGRFSCSSPNLQNIPSRVKGQAYDPRIQKLGKRLRHAFRAPTGYSLIVADQSQIELRLLAHYCQDRRLLQVYREAVQCDGLLFYTGDVHKITADSLGISRTEAKPVNFGFNYGMGPDKFARQQRLLHPVTGYYDIDRATKFRNGFFRTYPGVPMYMESLRDQWFGGARNFATISGRYRHFETEARITGRPVSPGTLVNSRIQGSSADLLKVVMYVFDKYIKARYPDAGIILQVHDELVFECRTEDAPAVAALIKYVMEYSWFSMSVPILAGVKICQRWSEKDDDNTPEYGITYAQINDKPRLFDSSNWNELLAIEKSDKKSITLKSSCATLSHKDAEFCRSIIPDRGPMFQSKSGTVLITREERLRQKAMSDF